MTIKQACLVIADLDDGTTAMNVVFDGGFDKTSPSHCALRKILQMLDDMGMTVVDPIEAPHIGLDFNKEGATVAIPAPMLVDGNGHTIIPS